MQGAGERAARAPLRADERRKGRAAGLLLALALVVSAALALLLLRPGAAGGRSQGPARAEGARPEATAGSAAPATGAAPAPPAEPSRLAGEVAEPAPGRDEAALEPGLGPPGPPPEDPRRFRGTGGLRGQLQARGPGFPETWTLVLGPSRFLSGRGQPAERRVVFTGGARDFEVTDLPLGGYDVRVEAPGWNSRIFPVLLDRATPSPFVNLEIHLAGRLEGRLTSADGLPADGVSLVLVSSADEARAEATSDLAGVFRFEGVLDGDHRLFIGHPNNPLLEPLSLSFEAPSMFLPPIELPPLGEAEFLASDVEGLPLAGVAVRGSGSQGGVIEGVTEPDGRLLVRWLPAGRYRVRADLDGKASRRAAFDLAGGEHAEVHLRLD